MRQDWLWLLLIVAVAGIGYVADISIPAWVFVAAFVVVMLIYVSLSLDRLHKKIDKAAERDPPNR